MPAFNLQGGIYITKRPNMTDELVNENIRFKEVLVIGPNGEQLGIKMRREALEAAYEYELDLFCVAPQGNPPVCKIMDYGKYRFELQKKNKEAKKNQHVTEVKPLRLSPVIDKHDFETKLKHAKTLIKTKKQDPNFNSKISAGLRQYWANIENRKKQSIAMTEKKASNKTIEKLRSSHLGHIVPYEIRQKISITLKNKHRQK